MTLHIKSVKKVYLCCYNFSLKNCTSGCHFVRIVILFAIPLTFSSSNIHYTSLFSPAKLEKLQMLQILLLLSHKRLTIYQFWMFYFNSSVAPDTKTIAEVDISVRFILLRQKLFLLVYTMSLLYLDCRLHLAFQRKIKESTEFWGHASILFYSTTQPRKMYLNLNSFFDLENQIFMVCISFV